MLLLEFAGLGCNANEIWELMDKIDTAHRSAGHKIRTKLMAELQKSDLSGLITRGSIEFDLEDVNVRSLGADIVEHVAPNYYDVPRSHLGRKVWVGE